MNCCCTQDAVQHISVSEVCRAVVWMVRVFSRQRIDTTPFQDILEMRFYHLRTLSGKHGSVLKSVHNKVTAENVREGGDVACKEGRRDGDEGAGRRRGSVDLWANKKQESGKACSAKFKVLVTIN